MEERDRIAVALLTCDRFDYTERTVSTFIQHNPPALAERFILLHGDDASADERVVPLVQAAGFETVVRTKTRKGWRAARTALIHKAAERADWILLLENDCETLRPFPWFLFDKVSKIRQVDCLRLYGDNKSDPPTFENRCLAHSKITGNPVKWKKVKGAPEPAEAGHVHWSAQPSVTRSAALLKLHYDGTDLRGGTVRVLKNVTSHIGVIRTRELA